MGEPKVFVNYRVQDAQGEAQGIAEALIAEFGEARVFFDATGLRAGDQWPERLDAEVDASTAMVAVIGTRWLSEQNEYHQRRIDQETDYVRRELERAFASGVRVIPVLVRGQQPLPEQALPPSLAALARCEALSIDAKSKARDSAKLIELLTPLLSATGDASGGWAPYLRKLLAKVELLKIPGLGSATGRVAVAQTFAIEQIYTPLCTRSGELELSEGRPHVPERVALATLIPRHARLLIEGKPGVGKSTFVNLVAACLCRDRLGVPCPGGGTWAQRHLGLDDGAPGAMPVLVRIAELLRFLAEGPAGCVDDRQALAAYLARWADENHLALPAARWLELLESEACWLLLDGLDEAAESDLRERALDVLRDICAHTRARIVVTSRPIQTEELEKKDFRACVIDDFGEAEIREFVDRWVTAIHHKTALGEFDADRLRYRDDLLAAIVDRPAVRRMAVNPVMLTSLCVVHWNEKRLPDSRSEVYHAVIRWLIRARSDRRREAGFNDEFAQHALGELALWMMQPAPGGKKRAVVGFADAADAIAPIVARNFRELPDADAVRDRAQRWLSFECLHSGIVQELPGRKLRFWHLTFQEFLAALRLARRETGENDAARDWWPVVRPRLHDAQWRETIDLLPGCLHEVGDPERVDLLLARVLALRGRKPDLPTEARIAGVVGRLLRALEAFSYRPDPEFADAYRGALARAMAVFEEEGAAQVPWRDRIAVAEALGQGGDPRLVRPRENLRAVPPIPGLRLGTYPVTVQEYQEFVEDNGYELPEVWSEDWQVRRKHGWTEPDDWIAQMATPNRPVVGVSWYEARAFCRWRTRQWGLEKEAVRLPTWNEQAAAAENPDGEYPWGKPAPDPERANFGLNVRAPSPVGVYPSGKGRYGHLDLSGNVWEWCTYAEGISAFGGGAWRHVPEGLRSTFRLRYRAGARDDDVGFRVAVIPASLGDS